MIHIIAENQQSNSDFCTKSAKNVIILSKMEAKPWTMKSEK